MMIRPKWLQENARLLLAATLILLVLVLIPGIGTTAGGARRWIRLLGFGFQPSELAKFVIIIYLADLTARKRFEITSLKRGFTPAFLVMGTTCGLILLEPDLGTSVSVAFISYILLFISGSRLKHILALFVAAVPALILAVLSEPYRIKRVTSFLRPWEDPKGTGFQLIQSFIALGSGGFFGVGLGASKQKLFYLPQAHTDFIYSIIGEELGFLGATAVLLLFGLLIWYTLKVAFQVKELFMSRVILGVGVMIAFEVIVNVGVSMGAVPTKGLPLPFISYGGSSLIFHMAAIGLVFNMAREAEL
jgi:cell division protein FtsW